MLVSILIPCYNAERWVAQAIESALAQTWPNKEVIVVDDGSRDGSLEIIRSFAPRIVWETGPNRGGNAARNCLLELSRGVWIQYLDADDYLLPEKVARQVVFAEQHPEVDVVYSRVQADFGSGPELNHFPIDEMWVSLALWFAPQTGGYLFRRDALADVGGWTVGQPCCQENDLVLRLLMQGKRFTHCPDSSAVYRLWGTDTVSRRNQRKTMEERLKILRREEDFLRESRQLTPKRLTAINQGRFDVARAIWLSDHHAALEIFRTIRESQPDFVPAGGAAPAGYRLFYKMFGFKFAQHVADSRRTVKRVLTGRSHA